MSEITGELFSSKSLSLFHYVVHTQKALRDPRLLTITRHYDARYRGNYTSRVDRWYEMNVGWCNYWSVNELGSVQLYEELWTKEGYQRLTGMWKSISDDCDFILFGPKPVLQESKRRLSKVINPRRESYDDLGYMSTNDEMLSRCFKSIQTNLQDIVETAKYSFDMSHRKLIENSAEELRAKEKVSFELMFWHHYWALHKYCTDPSTSPAMFLELKSIITDDNRISSATSPEARTPTVQPIIWTMRKPLSTYQKRIDFLIPDSEGICGFLTEDSDLIVDYSDTFSHVIKNNQLRILNENFFFTGVRLGLALVLAKAGIPLLNTPWFSNICSCQLRRTMSKPSRIGIALAASPSHQTKTGVQSSTSAHWCDYIIQSDKPLRRLGMVLAEIGIGAPIYFGTSLLQELYLPDDLQDDMITQRIRRQISLGSFPEPYAAGGLPEFDTEINLILERVKESTNSRYFREAVSYCFHGQLRSNDKDQHNLEEYNRKVIVP